jgi:hypothetical protein
MSKTKGDIMQGGLSVDHHYRTMIVDCGGAGLKERENGRRKPFTAGKYAHVC